MLPEPIKSFDISKQMSPFQRQPESGPEAKLLPEVITGWRVWWYNPDQGMLLSKGKYSGIPWSRENPQPAECKILDSGLDIDQMYVERKFTNGVHGRAPEWECECGYYAFRSMLSHAHNALVLLASGSIVVGRVEMWGRVIEHERGYRAEYARPIEIVRTMVDQQSDYAARAASYLYQVPIRDLTEDEMDQLVRAIWKCEHWVAGQHSALQRIEKSPAWRRRGRQSTVSVSPRMRRAWGP